jgi:ATP-binding cassette subfamily F protein uup
MIAAGGETRHVASYLKDFLFSPEQMGTPLRVLSGGERARLMIARAMALPSNLLILDEPTNDLDLDTLDVLQDMLGSYEGTVILISHDRDFLDRIVGSVLAPEGGGVWREYAGGYSDMLAQRGAELEKAAPAKEKAAPAKAGKPRAAAGEKPKRDGSRSRLSFKDKHALERLPGEIEALRAQARELEAKLADPQLFTSDRAAFDEATARLAAVHRQLREAEDRWLELEMLREALENG